MSRKAQLKKLKDEKRSEQDAANQESE